MTRRPSAATRVVSTTCWPRRSLTPDTDIESWAPAPAKGANTEVLQWMADQMRGKRHGNHTLMAMVATLVGVAVLPLAHMPQLIDIGM